MVLLFLYLFPWIISNTILIRKDLSAYFSGSKELGAGRKMKDAYSLGEKNPKRQSGW